MSKIGNSIVSLARSLGAANHIRRGFDRLGFHVQRREDVPQLNWLGVKSLPIDTILDIGACRGGFAAETLQPAFPNAQIFSFEPSPTAFVALKQRALASNGRIIAQNYALGDESGMLPFYETQDALYSSSLLRTTDLCQELFPDVVRTEVREVPVRRLDDVFPALLPPPGDEILIKMDVQGFEDRVIKGGARTFKQARACLLEVQIAHLYEGQPSFLDLARLMEQAGLSYAGNLDQYYDSSRRVLYFDAMFVRWAAPIKEQLRRQPTV